MSRKSKKLPQVTIVKKMIENGRLFLMVQFADGFIEWQEVDPRNIGRVKVGQTAVLLHNHRHQQKN
jgi:hypothetical protein